MPKMIITNERSVQRPTSSDIGLSNFDPHGLTEDSSGATPSDTRAMRRMGHQQQFRRHYRSYSMVAFVFVAISSWQLTIFQITPGLVNGGKPVLMYSNLWSSVAFLPVILSMAEMASMEPVAGAQYHWVSKFAPEKYQRVLSYLTGWTSTLAWQAGNASSVLLIGTLIQTIIKLNMPNYDMASWHATLLAMAILILSCSINIFVPKSLPYWQNAAFAIGFLVYLAFIVPVWVAAPVASSTEVWTEFELGEGAWPDLALAICIGQFPALIGQIGIDTTVHMSEEVKNASSTVPRVMIVVFALNVLLNIITTTTLCYHMPDSQSALQDTSTYPAIWVLRQVMSDRWLSVLLGAIIILLIVGAITYLTAVSRDIFAFARDGGVPYHKWIAQVDSCNSKNAIAVTAIVDSSLCLIFIGSPVAFYAICSLCAVALLQCYSLSIASILWRRVCYAKKIPMSTFSLGRYGVPVNIAALVSCIWAFFWCFWPTTYPVTAGNFNWSAPILIGVLFLASMYYVLAGNRHYLDPSSRGQAGAAYV